MSDKSIDFKSKLLNREPPEPKGTEKKKIGIIEKKDHPRSYRWRPEDLRLIDDLVEKANTYSKRKIDSTKVIRGALYLARNISGDKLIKAIKDADYQ